MKKSIIFATVICLVLAVITTVSAFALSDYNIRLGNDNITMKYPSFVQNDRVYVSIRNLCDALGIPIYWNEGENEVYMDIYNKKVPVSDKTSFKEDGVIPNEEAALAIGKIILEEYAGRSLEYETDEKIYYLKVTYIKETNAWNVTQFFEYKDGRRWTASGVYLPTVKLNKNTGEVMNINTYSSYTD